MPVRKYPLKSYHGVRHAKGLGDHPRSEIKLEYHTANGTKTVYYQVAVSREAVRQMVDSW